MTISVFKDIAEALSVAGEAISGLTNAFKHLAVTGNDGYKYVSAQRDYSRLKDISARLSMLGAFSNARVVGSIDEYLEKESPSLGDWYAVIDGVTNALTDVHSILDDVKKERSDFVLEEAFFKLTNAISSRVNLLSKLRKLTPPETPDEINDLIVINNNYKNLITQLRLVINELNAYLLPKNA